jgi:hypothetical protein
MIEKKVKTLCKNCKKPITISMIEWVMYNEFCEHCWYQSPLDYYKNPENGKAFLLTAEDAEKLGYLKKCPKCKWEMEDWEYKEYGCCLFCSV